MFCSSATGTVEVVVKNQSCIAKQRFQVISIQTNGRTDKPTN